MDPRHPLDRRIEQARQRLAAAQAAYTVAKGAKDEVEARYGAAGRSKTLPAPAYHGTMTMVKAPIASVRREAMRAKKAMKDAQATLDALLASREHNPLSAAEQETLGDRQDHPVPRADRETYRIIYRWRNQTGELLESLDRLPQTVSDLRHWAASWGVDLGPYPDDLVVAMDQLREAAQAAESAALLMASVCLTRWRRDGDHVAVRCLERGQLPW